MSDQAKILIVEDEGIVARDIQNMLKRLGFARSTIAYSGREVLSRAREFRPDLVLMDIKLKGKIDGIQVAEQLRNKFDIPIVFLTAYSDHNTLQQAKISVPYGYILKPVEMRELQTGIDMALYRHRIEKNLRESEERLRSVVQTANDAILTINLQRRIVFCNSAAETIFGYSSDELLNKPVSLMIPKRNRIEFHKGLRQILTEKRSKYGKETIEFTGLNRGGQEFPMEVSFAVWKIKGDKFCTAIIRDITERKRSEKALALQVKQLTALSEASQALAASLDLDKVLSRIVTLATKITASTYTIVILVDNFGQIEKHYENLPGATLKKFRIRKKGLTQWIITSRKPVIIDDIRKDGTFTPSLESAADAPRTANSALVKAAIRSVAGLPLLAKHNLEGVLYLYSTETEAFRKQLPVLKAFANQVAIALENARLYEMIRQELFSRKQTEEALRLERDFAEGLVNTAQTIVLVLDTKARIVKFNPYMEEISGYKLMEVQGQSWDSVFLAKDAAKSVKNFFFKATTNDRSHGTNPIVTKKGIERTIEWNNKTLKDKHGKVMGVLAIGQDITKRQEMEESLRLSEERYRTISGLTSDFAYAFRVEADGRLISEWITGALFRITGFTQEQLMAEGGWDQILHPDDQPLAREKATALLNGNSKVVEYRIVTKKNEIRWMRDYGHPVWDEAQGRVTYIHGAVQDITEPHLARGALQESEERFRGIAERSIDAIFAIDPENNFTYASPAIKTIGGYNAEEIHGRPFVEIIEASSIRAAEEMFSQLMNGGSVENIELVVKKSDGHTVTVEINASPICKDGKSVGFQGMMRDISERKRAMEELSKSREQLRNLTAHLQSVREEERMRIAREIHDEVGQTLTALKIDLAWLINRFTGEQENLVNKAKSMNHLIDSSIMTMKRISTELRPVLLDDVGLEAAVDWQIEEFQKRTGIQCQVALGSGEITLDKDRSIALFRIFQETLTNIARHANATRVKVILEKNSEEIVLKISDNGIGITAEKMLALDSFGLIGMKERAHFLGGQIDIEGKENRGTTVMVRIPFQQGGKIQ